MTWESDSSLSHQCLRRISEWPLFNISPQPVRCAIPQLRTDSAILLGPTLLDDSHRPRQSCRIEGLGNPGELHED